MATWHPTSHLQALVCAEWAFVRPEGTSNQQSRSSKFIMGFEGLLLLTLFSATHTPDSPHLVGSKSFRGVSGGDKGPSGYSSAGSVGCVDLWRGRDSCDHSNLEESCGDATSHSASKTSTTGGGGWRHKGHNQGLQPTLAAKPVLTKGANATGGYRRPPNDANFPLIAKGLGGSLTQAY